MEYSVLSNEDSDGDLKRWGGREVDEWLTAGRGMAEESRIVSCLRTYETERASGRFLATFDSHDRQRLASGFPHNVDHFEHDGVPGGECQGVRTTKYYGRC